MTFWPFWATDWVPWVWKGCVRPTHHMAKPGDPLSSSKQPKNWDLGSKMAIKLIFWPFWASEWVPLRLKRLHKDQASHGIAMDTPHAYILKRKQIGKKRGTTSVAGHSLYSDQIQMMRKIGMWGSSRLAVNRWRLKNSFDFYVFHVFSRLCMICTRTVASLLEPAWFEVPCCSMVSPAGKSMINDTQHL